MRMKKKIWEGAEKIVLRDTEMRRKKKIGKI